MSKLFDGFHEVALIFRVYVGSGFIKNMIGESFIPAEKPYADCVTSERRKVYWRTSVMMKAVMKNQLKESPQACNLWCAVES